MTSTTLTEASAPSPSTPGALRRIVNVARLLFVNKMTMIGMPWMIMGIIFFASLSIWWLISYGLNNGNTSNNRDVFLGSASFLVVYMLVVAVQAINLTFPFAQGYSVTRRDFYLSSSLAFIGLSVGYAIAVTALGQIERATNGWGLEGRMFDYASLGNLNLAETLYVTFIAFLFFFFLGAAVASMYVRWRMYGLIGFFAGLLLLAIGSIALATLTNSWGLVGNWFVVTGVVGFASWALVPTALAAISGFSILRRATPRN